MSATLSPTITRPPQSADPVQSPEFVYGEDSVPQDLSFHGATEVLVAQQFNQDVLGDIHDGFSNFIESGQVWALLIGLVLGYMIRGITR